MGRCIATVIVHFCADNHRERYAGKSFQYPPNFCFSVLDKVRIGQLQFTHQGNAGLRRVRRAST